VHVKITASQRFSTYLLTCFHAEIKLFQTRTVCLRHRGRSSRARSVSHLPPPAWRRLQTAPDDYSRQMLRLAATTTS